MLIKFSKKFLKLNSKESMQMKLHIILNLILLTLFLIPTSNSFAKNSSELIKNKPVIFFIPGFLGSKLMECNKLKTDCDYIWGKDLYAGDLIIKKNKTYLAHELNEIDIKFFSNIHMHRVYGEFSRYLRSNTQPYFDTVALPYDWRNSMSLIAQDLNQKICLEAGQSKRDVYFIAHSMGGNVLKYWLSEYGKKKCKNQIDIKGIFFVATPHYGTPETIASLLEGYNVLRLETSRNPSKYAPYDYLKSKANELISQYGPFSSAVTRGAPWFNSTYELLPIYRNHICKQKNSDFNNASNNIPSPITVLKSLVGDNKNHSKELDIYKISTWKRFDLSRYYRNHQMAFPSDRVLNSQLSRAAQLLCKTALLNPNDFAPYVKYFIGLHSINTVGSLRYKENLDGLHHNSPAIELVAGDNTVILESAMNSAMENSEREIVQGQNGSHLNILSSSSVKKAIVSLIELYKKKTPLKKAGYNNYKRKDLNKIIIKQYFTDPNSQKIYEGYKQCIDSQRISILKKISINTKYSPIIASSKKLVGATDFLKDREVFLSFRGLPSQNVLDILAAHCTHVTFFIDPRSAIEKENMNLILSALARGHNIGLLFSKEVVENNKLLEATEITIHKILGKIPGRISPLIYTDDVIDDNVKKIAQKMKASIIIGDKKYLGAGNAPKYLVLSTDKNKLYLNKLISYLHRNKYQIIQSTTPEKLTPEKFVYANYDVKQVIKTYADIAYASYEDSLITAKKLQMAIDILIATPTEANLAAAKKSWIVSRVPYQQSEVYRFGNAIVDDWESKVNGRPLDEGLIDYVSKEYGTFSDENELYVANVIANKKIMIGGKTVDASTIDRTLISETLHEAGDTEANVATGYHVIEFLLWGQDLNSTSKGAGTRKATDYDVKNCTHGNCNRRAAFLRAATNLLIDDLTWMVAQWDDKGTARKELMVKSERDTLTAIFTGLGSLSYGELVGERMKPGLILHDPEEEYDVFSDNTHFSHFNSALGIQNVYLGRYRRIDGTVVKGASVSGLVKARNARIDTILRASFDATMNAMEALVKRAENVEAYDQMIGEHNKKGNAIVQAAIDKLTSQTEAIKQAVAALNLKAIEFESSDSLKSPSMNVQR